jgi:hypothetical protein
MNPDLKSNFYNLIEIPYRDLPGGAKILRIFSAPDEIQTKLMTLMTLADVPDRLLVFLLCLVYFYLTLPYIMI